MTTLAALTIHEAHDGLTSKKFSSRELTSACLAAIQEKNAQLNAYVHVQERGALAAAAKADAMIAAGREDIGPLRGVPAALKDVFSTAGAPTTACSNILKNFIPPYDATAVSRLKKAGMVLLGKTNTDEFTCGASTETSAFGTSKNPADPTRTPGGSSGGSAVAVGADMCIYALGTDTGGSIRQPASFCGVTGLKVTYGRVSRFGVISMASSLDTIGPMCKDVTDVAIVMNEIAGMDSFDSTTPDVAVPDYLEALKEIDVRGIKIGLPREYFIPGMDPQVEACVQAAVKELQKKGAIVREVSLPNTPYALAVYYIICPSEVSANMARYDGIRYGAGTNSSRDLFSYYTKTRGAGFGPEMKRRIMIGTYCLSAGYYDAYYKKAQQVRTLVKRDFDEAFKEVDVLIAPVAPTPAFKIGAHANDPVQMYLEDVFTVSINIAGVPALAVPCGASRGGLPIGMQIIGPQFGEDLLLKVGRAYELAHA